MPTPSLVLLLLVLAQSAPVPRQTPALDKYPVLSAVPPELQAATEPDRHLATYFDRLSDQPLRPGLSWIMHGESLAPHPSATAFDLLRWSVCAADRVVIGTVRSARVLANTRATALFTIYRIETEDHVRPTTGPAVIRLARAGGSAPTPQGPISFSVGPMLEPGRTYALVVKAVDQADAFVLTGSVSLVELGDRTRVIVGPHLVTPMIQDRSNFRIDLGNAAAACGNMR